MRVLVTGGLGYIGAIIVALLIKHGIKVTVLDNLSNSRKEKLEILEKVTSCRISFYEGDVRDMDLLSALFEKEDIDFVIHLAGLKSVGESNLEPVRYYSNNVAGTINLIHAMAKAKIFSLIFSSSATVYGVPKYLPIDEGHPLLPTNPYGRSKLIAEEVLKDLADSDTRWKILCLRYFNPVGAHESAMIGEDPKGIPNNLTPYLFRVAKGEYSVLKVFGGDYPTLDGTGVRDYIDINDLAEAHLAALRFIEQHETGFYDVVNIGTGIGYSVMEVVKSLNHILGSSIPIELVGRRRGDVGVCYASALKAEKLLGWKAAKNIDDMCSSGWNYYKNKQS